MKLMVKSTVFLSGRHGYEAIPWRLDPFLWLTTLAAPQAHVELVGLSG